VFLWLNKSSFLAGGRSPFPKASIGSSWCGLFFYDTRTVGAIAVSKECDRPYCGYQAVLTSRIT
jgi:hypothetical protein